MKLGIVGLPNVGKSTLFNAITGGFIADEGSISLGGENITFAPEYQRSKVIGHLFQDPLKEGKIIEDRGYETVYGLWRYFTADNMNLEEKSYLGIGTLESYEKLKAYYGEEKIRPIYIEVEDGERLKRAIAREETQEAPKYEEMCRRFLADAQDFSEEKIRQAGISHRFSNMDGAGGYSEIEKYLRSVL